MRSARDCFLPSKKVLILTRQCAEYGLTQDQKLLEPSTINFQIDHHQSLCKIDRASMCSL